jgi:calcineurin-like phosphoesterase
MSDNQTSETNPFKHHDRKKPSKIDDDNIIVVDLDADSKSEYETLGQVLGKRSATPADVMSPQV